MVIHSASVPRHNNYSHYIKLSLFSLIILHRTVNFFKGKNEFFKTWCFKSDLAFWLTLEIVCVSVCVCVYVKITLYIQYNFYRKPGSYK